MTSGGGVGARAALAAAPLAACVCLAGCGDGSSSSTAESEPVWGQFRADPSQSGRTDFDSTGLGAVQWAVPVGSALRSVVTVDGQGVLRVKGDGPDLIAIDPDGVELWRAVTGPGSTAPVIDPRGTAHVGTDDGRVVGVAADGRTVYDTSIGGDLGSGLFYRGDVICWPATSGVLTFVTTEGEVTGSVGVGALGSGVPAQSSRQQIWAASSDGNLYEVLLNGTTGLPSRGVAFRLPGPASHATPVGDARFVYVVTDADILVKVMHEAFDDADPIEVFRFDPQIAGSEGGRSAPAIGRDGGIYYGTQDGRLIALDARGNLRWEYSTGGAGVRSSPILDAGENLIFRAADGAIHSVTRAGEPRFVRQRTDAVSGPVDSSPSLDPAGNLYLGTNRGLLLKLGQGPVVTQRGVDATHRGVVGAEGASTARLEWSVQVSDAPPAEAPLVFGDGAIVFRSADGFLHVVDRDGRLERSLVVGGLVRGTALGLDGTIYTTTSAGRLQGRTREGVTLFDVALQPGVSLSPPTVASDGTLRVATQGGVLLFVSAEGVIDRRVAVSSVADSAPAIDDRGDTIVAGSSGRVISHTAAGALRFQFVLPGPVTRSSPAVDEEGTIYLATDDDELVAVTPSGIGRWTFDPPGNAAGDGGRGGPVLAPDGTVLYVTRAGVLFGIDRELGTRALRVDLGAPASSPPLIGPEGRIYLTDTSGCVRVLDLAGTPLFTVDPRAIDGMPLSVAAAPVGDRGLVIVSDGGRVSLLRDGLAWPMLQGGPDHRARVTSVGPRVGGLTWTATLSDVFSRAPILTRDGGVAVHGDVAFHLLDAGGGLRTQFAIEGPSVPLETPRGLRIVGASNGVLSAFRADDTPAWSLTLAGAIGALTRTRAGAIVAVAGDEVALLDERGGIGWRRTLEPLSSGTVAEDFDGRLWVATANGLLVGLDAAGNVVARIALSSPTPRATPLVTARGEVVLVTDTDELLFVDVAAGEVRARFDPMTGGSGGSSEAPALLADGRVAYGASDGTLYLVNQGGTLDFFFETNQGPLTAAPVVDAEGVVYIGSAQGTLYGISGGGFPVLTQVVDPGRSADLAGRDRFGVRAGRDGCRSRDPRRLMGRAL